MDEQARALRGALSRQPACPFCTHEEHQVFACEDCPCPPGHPLIGVYATEEPRHVAH